MSEITIKLSQIVWSTFISFTKHTQI